MSSFFRDAEAFNTLQKKILPNLIAKKPEAYTVRVWVPGCGTGEEAYSIAILLRECMQEANLDFKVQIFGTDIDAEAVAIARAGVYSGNIAGDISVDRLRRFFIK